MCFEELWGWIESVSQKEPAKQKYVGTHCLFSNEPTREPNSVSWAPCPFCMGMCSSLGFFGFFLSEGKSKVLHPAQSLAELLNFAFGVDGVCFYRWTLLVCRLYCQVKHVTIPVISLFVF